MTDMLARRIAAGRGEVPAERVLKNVRLYCLATGALIDTDIAMMGETIVGTHGRYKGEVEIDGEGLIAVPGFIDTHLHVESSLITPYEFERCVLPHGVTTAICDPHEIANVLGAEGIRYFLDSASNMVMSLFVQLSSCVPATHLETAGAALSADDLTPFMDHPKVIGLAEFMNFPGVIHRDPGCMAKLAAFRGRHIDGHAPLLRGLDLNGYLSAGILTDHECTGLEEAREKIAKGMAVLIREGSVSKDMHALQPLIDLATAPFLAFCTDDRNPLDIAEEGHLDFMIRSCIAMGSDPLAVYRVATMSAAQIFGLNDRGFLAPGKRADIVLIDDLATCHVRRTFVGGMEPDAARFAARPAIPPVGLASMKPPRITPELFKVSARAGETPVIGVVPGRIITERLSMTLPSINGEALIDLEQDAIKVAVIERHGKSGTHAAGFVHGFAMKRGAIASSVGHDSHNICVVGVNNEDMALAADRLSSMGGGFAVAECGRITGELALPVAGLMSLGTFEEVREALIPLRAAAKALGCTLAEPFLQVAFLPLPVIPHLKITDKGLVDVDGFGFV
ncbi:MAG: adenine deaminase [Bosea sp. (in: a-proteobacteria)]